MPGIPEIVPYEMPTDLPPNTARWTVDPTRAVLLVHDMQRFFLRPFDNKAPAPALVANATSLRRRAAALGIPVAYTAQPGGMTPAERGLLKDFWGLGMTPTPADREVIGPLKPGPADWLLTKWRYSAFFNTELRARMWRAGRDQLVICGVYAHVGVLMSAVEAFTYDIQPFLVADAVADFGEAEHRLALDYAAGRCAVVTTTDDVLAQLRVTEAA
ncbi:isochorismatase family protein [Actinophytocola sp.]|uniref:isochorismatase family protein n=1 Tax=Actinophytocola sp. TaxID=1872138 RepID=UPI00389A462F